MRIVGSEVIPNQLEALALLLPDWQEAPILATSAELIVDGHPQVTNDAVKIQVDEVNLTIAVARDMRLGYEAIMSELQSSSKTPNLIEWRIHNDMMIDIIEFFSKGVQARLSRL